MAEHGVKWERVERTLVYGDSQVPDEEFVVWVTFNTARGARSYRLRITGYRATQLGRNELALNEFLMEVANSMRENPPEHMVAEEVPSGGVAL